MYTARATDMHLAYARRGMFAVIFTELIILKLPEQSALVWMDKFKLRDSRLN